jgi:cell division septal protein FtsQ
MNRQTRRRLAVVGAAAAIGIASPFWGPAVLRTMPAFGVVGIDVHGARFVSPEAARALAAIPPDASVWDDHSGAEDRLATHPLIEDARIRRDGFNRLVIELHEVRPVALVPTPTLEPVDGRGTLIPVDPAEHALDLPILQRAEVQDGRVTDEDSRRVLAVLERLGDLSPEFVQRVSEIRRWPGDAVELVLLDGSHIARMILPLDDAELAFLRAEDAIGECGEKGRVVAVDARFRDQVVVQIEGRA